VARERNLGAHAVLRPLAKKLLRAGGIVAARYEPNRDPEAMRGRLLERERIDVVFDVGANRGQYARQLRHCGYRNRIVSFEPLSSAFALLEQAAIHDEAWDVERCALGDTDGTASINIAGNSWSSSILAMLPRHLEAAPESAYVGQETVPLARLDSLFERFAMPDDRVFVKIDTQGFTAQVLRGLAGHMDRVLGFEIELSTVPLYQGEPLLHEVLAMLHGRGFALFYVEPAVVDPATGQQLQMNGLLLRGIPA
jgi:FkbM family methyltransferase